MSGFLSVLVSYGAIPSAGVVESGPSDIQIGSGFGRALAISGDGSRLVIGAPYAEVGDAGSVYVFVKDGSNWVQESKITASNGVANDWFGNSVDITHDGSKIIVGATGKDDLGDTDCGGHYFYTRSGSTWGNELYIPANGGGSNDFTGSSVAINATGTYKAVGSYMDDGNGTSSGSVMVYSNDTTLQHAFDGSESKAYLGWSMGISDLGDRVISGQYGENNNNKTDNGSVKIYRRSGSSWSTEDTIYATGSATGDYFGWSVGIDGTGTYAVVGAPEVNASGYSAAGSAYIFSRSGSVWTQKAKLTPNPTNLGHIGRSVAMNADGTVAVVSAESENTPGAAYVYKQSNNIWTLAQTLTVAGILASDGFGSYVDIDASGETVVVGAAGKGKIYVFSIQ